MRVVSFREAGRDGCGVVDDDGTIAVLAAGGLQDVLAAPHAPPARTGRRLSLDAVELLPPVPAPGKILCVGLNYGEHVAETGRERAGHPTVFTRFADTQVGHRGTILRPAESAMLDYEGELAVVIGRGGRRIAEADALDHVAGYACYNDASVRDWQRHGTQWTPGKNFPATGGFGPWLVTSDELPDPGDLRIATRINGAVVQDARTSQLIFPIPALIAYVSRFTPLAAGDVLCTGTPGGVGFARTPPVFLQPGDTVEVAIERVGTLVNTIGQEES